MQEILPVAAGALIGLAAPRIASQRLRWLVVAAASVLVGVVASAVSGELAESPAFILVDTAQVLVVAVLAGAAMMLWQRRASLGG